MERQKIMKSHYLAAFAIATLVFVGGILIGNFFSQEKLNKINQLEQDIKMDTMGTELQYMLLSENPCTGFDYATFSKELFNMGARLEYMESQLGVNDPRVLELKEYYMLLEIRHWLFLKKVSEECNYGYDLILYFYSNKGDCTDCDKQAYVLNYLHNKYLMNIYSFDVNIDNPLTYTLKSMYNLTSVPSLVINGEPISGFVKADEIERIIGTKEIKSQD